MSVEIIKANNSYSEAQYSDKKIFVFDNRFQNRETTDTAVVYGGLVCRKSAGIVEAATSDNLEKVIGISASNVETSGVLAYATKGTVYENNLTFPGGVTLDTMIGETGLTLRDKLESLGFHLEIADIN